jgi:hypothetical protein
VAATELKLCQDGSGFKAIRFHGLLQDEMGVYSKNKDGQPKHNWKYIARSQIGQRSPREAFDWMQLNEKAADSQWRHGIKLPATSVSLQASWRFLKPTKQQLFNMPGNLLI